MKYQIQLKFNRVSICSKYLSKSYCLKFEDVLLLKIFKKVAVILLFWFATHQQTSTFRRQRNGFFYTKFNAKFNELGHGF